MANKKKQHYVPRFYLKNFSLDNLKKEIRIFNINSSKFIPSGSLKNQAYGDYFYGRDLKIENSLKVLEDISAPIIQNIIIQNSVPSIESREYQTLLTFLLSLEARTPYKVDQLNEFADKLVKAAIKNSRLAPNLNLNAFSIDIVDPSKFALRNALLGLPLVLDLGLKVAINNTQEPFITSDNPVVLYNQFLESRKKYGSNTGLACQGLELFLPISPRHLLVFFDRDIYKVGCRKNIAINVNNVGDVNNLNSLQCINAKENLYFNDEISEIQIRQLMNQSIRLRRKTKANVDKPIALKTDKVGKFPFHMYGTDIKCSLSLSFIHLLKNAKKYILEDEFLHVRNISTCLLHDQFVKQVNKGRYKITEFPKFLRTVDKY
jgi:Protein of unknown function (DUF4238)